jgi:2-dehydropantoate 2-reductase
MKIAVVGAGAMGSLFGGLLTESGADVWLLDIWAEHIKAVNDNGLNIEREGKFRSVSVKATTDPNRIGISDLVISFVKSTNTSQAAKTAKFLIDDSSLILTLQNGMGNADTIAEVIEPTRIIAGTTSHGATMLGPGSIRHAGIGPTTIGMWVDGGKDKALYIAKFLTEAGIKTEAVDDIQNVIWNKLLVNVGINAITALTGIKNGQLLDLSATRDISRAAVEEAMELARAQGVMIREDSVGHVFEIAKATSPNRSSMGQDVDNKRLTEIEAINGFVVREASKIGLKVPVNKTLTALIETLQSHYE